MANPAQFYEQAARHLWHPYTKFSAIEAEGLPMMVRGEGIYLFDAEGNRYVDAIASWWACALGHGHPRIVEAIRRQAGELQHSILANLSHPRAVELAGRLAALMPTPDRHVLFASDGASAVEAALKIALQFRCNAGQPERRRFAYLEEAYHGDTLGAVSVGYLEGFHKPFESVLFPAFEVPVPHAPAQEEECFQKTAKVFEQHRQELTALIVEPLCQGAAGMKMYSPAYLRRLADLCRQANVLLIADEIAMGFGRTGKMFAFEHAGIDPDIVCVGKALSAGYLPISATIVKDEIYGTFADSPADHSFYHGHTFCGNPIAAAAALEALRLYNEERLCEKAAAISEIFRTRLEALKGRPGVRDIRILGAIAAVELDSPAAA
ncbi:MAG: adenosylmethionine--8-amino-7-oxononanoate transaminase, partial [Verrucomicrobia bacterium]|nr:adenosylmethionine--8-amino-7-oxononanoate transaminase [Verrucomicrobiota bacterium]